ncbi:hypothetical protein [Curtobacterium sp. VKM Ac-2852]|uniref:hypothetical protein n=1 Tax=Curtobacterium sp. VKM Ac-2852 TaxID=2739024 RepID=UPI0015679046|nr:hypothetical protein [Curtobacterium sp. VKM Ac-2852]NQX25646.1 hypothetical protein [Curtobacterium sp. VKM Ac-2852]
MTSPIAPPPLAARFGRGVEGFFRHPATIIFLVVAVGVALALPVILKVPGSPWIAFLSVCLGAACAVAKEMLSAIAQDRKNAGTAEKPFTDAAIVCSVYTAVFTFPGLVAAATPLIFGK